MVVILSTSRLSFLSATVLLFVLSSILLVSVVASNNQELAISTIIEAEQSMARAYAAVLDAERVGADVSGLLGRLNEGAAWLSEARMAFEDDKFEEAVRVAELTSEVGFEVVGKADGFKVETGQAHVNRMWWFIVGSILAVSIVIVASLLSYQYFKRRYYRRLLKMRSRVE